MIAMLAVFPAAAAEYSARIASNYDGDTVHVVGHLIGQGSVTVRIANIDAPEIEGRCDSERVQAQRARDFVSAWHKGQTVTLTVSDKRPRDQYGRLLANVRNENGEDLGDALVKAGLARPWRGKRERWC